MFNVLLYYSDCRGCCLPLMTWLMSPCSSSSYKCEAVGHRPPVFPDHHDEDRSHQAHRVHGVFEKVSVQEGRGEPCWCPSPAEEPGAAGQL